MKNEVSAVVVARGGSVRMQKKSLLKIGQETLIERKIRQLRSAKNIQRVIFGSDDEEMLQNAKKAGAETFQRPDFFCDERLASANDMIENMLSFFETGFVVWAHCTNPLIDSHIYDDAIEKFFCLFGENKIDSLCSVVELREHLWCRDTLGNAMIVENNDRARPLNYNPYSSVHTPASKIAPYYMQDGGIFIQPYLQMKRNRYFFGKKPLLYLIGENSFLDINTKRDYILAASLESGGGGYKCYILLCSKLFYLNGGAVLCLLRFWIAHCEMVVMSTNGVFLKNK